MFGALRAQRQPQRMEMVTLWKWFLMACFAFIALTVLLTVTGVLH